MPNLTIKGIPDELLDDLRGSAARHRRSLNSEVIVLLEEALGHRARSRTAVLDEIRAARNRMPTVDHGSVTGYKREGRT